MPTWPGSERPIFLKRVMFSNRTQVPKFGQVLIFGLKWGSILILSWSILLLFLGRVSPLDPARPLEIRVLVQGLLPFLGAILDPKLGMVVALPVLGLLTILQAVAAGGAGGRATRLAGFGLFCLGFGVLGLSKIQHSQVALLAEDDANRMSSLNSRGVSLTLKTIFVKLGEREVADDLRFRVRFKDRRRFLPGWGKISDQEQVLDRVATNEWMRFMPDREVLGWRTGMGDPPHFEARIREFQREKTDNTDVGRSVAHSGNASEVPDTVAQVEVAWVDGKERVSERELTLYPGFAQHARQIQRGLAFELVLEPAPTGKAIEVTKIPSIWVALLLIGTFALLSSALLAPRKGRHAGTA